MTLVGFMLGPSIDVVLGTARRTLALLAVLCSLSAGARGVSLNEPLRDATSRLIEGSALVLAVDGAARWRHGPAGDALLELLRGVEGEPSLNAAWDELAEQLGLQGPETFDALLGHRAWLVVGYGERDPHWALLTYAKRELVERLRAGATPRRLVDGQRVLGLEGNAYELALLKPDGSAPRDLVQMAIGPARGSALLDRMLRGGEGNAGKARGLLSKVDRLPDGQVLIVSGREGRPIRAASVRIERARLDVSLLLRGERPDRAAVVAKRSLPSEPAALLTCAMALDERVMGAMLAWVPGNDRGAVSGAAAGPMTLSVVPQGEHGVRVQLGMAFDPSTDAAMLDRAVASPMVRAMVGSPVPDHAGRFPSAERVEPLGEGIALRTSGLFEAGGSLRWRYERTPDLLWCRVALGERAANDGESGEKIEPPPGSVFSWGRARPSALLSRLERAGLVATDPLMELARRVSQARWVGRYEDDGSRQLELSLEFGDGPR